MLQKNLVDISSHRNRIAVRSSVIAFSAWQTRVLESPRISLFDWLLSKAFPPRVPTNPIDISESLAYQRRLSRRDVSPLHEGRIRPVLAPQVRSLGRTL
jgi:hypothetical protein